MALTKISSQWLLIALHWQQLPKTHTAHLCFPTADFPDLLEPTQPKQSRKSVDYTPIKGAHKPGYELHGVSNCSAIYSPTGFPVSPSLVYCL